jgi:hypothetical protein
MQLKELVGTWKLISFKITWDKTDKVIYPFGEDALGYLIYTLDGHMSVQFMRANRTNCSTDEYKNLSTKEKIEIATNFGGYSGTYQIHENKIIHHPLISAFPNFIRIPQVREYELVKDLLILKCAYPKKEMRKEGLSQIIWERLKN